MFRKQIKVFVCLPTGSSLFGRQFTDEQKHKHQKYIQNILYEYEYDFTFGHFVTPSSFWDVQMQFTQK